MEEGPNVKANLIIAMQTLSTTKFSSIIKTTKVPLYSLRDSNDSNIFHELSISCIKETSLIEFFNILVQEFQDRYFEDSISIIKSMLNARRANDSQTPLLEAVCYNRKVVYIQKLIKNYIGMKADPYSKNANNQGPVHIAADRGFDAVLVYLCKELNLRIDEPDANGLTPLHLAVSHGNATTALLLIAWGADINFPDSNKNTPLHLAASCSCYKIIRNLLIRGADKHAKNNLNQSPLDVALQTNSSEVIRLLVFFIQKSKHFLWKINPFSEKIENVKNKPYKCIIFIVIFIIRSIFLLNFYPSNFLLYYYLVSIISILITSILFIKISFFDPGFVKKTENGIIDLIEKYRSEFICPFCETKKQANTRHCHYCNKCVEVKTK